MVKNPYCYALQLITLREQVVVDPFAKVCYFFNNESFLVDVLQEKFPKIL
jgi:hypothetical protein